MLSLTLCPGVSQSGLWALFLLFFGYKFQLINLITLIMLIDFCFVYFGGSILYSTMCALFLQICQARTMDTTSSTRNTTVASSSLHQNHQRVQNPSLALILAYLPYADRSMLTVYLSVWPENSINQ